MEKIKQFIQSEKGKDILIVIIVILVGLGSFELGRLSKDSASAGINILPAQTGEYATQEASAISAVEASNSLVNTKISPTVPKTTSKNFFASKRGNKYYSIGCSAGKTIKQENRVYFATKDDAEDAGYELSSSCR